MDQLDFSGRSRTFTVPPLKEHKQTFILLHGRGDRADVFGAGILMTQLQDGTDLRLKFPHAKFVFLQAPLRQLAAAPSIKYNQWFDVWSLRPGHEEDDLQIEGLRETVLTIHNALRQEIELTGAENVILGGLSQGCASSLISLLLWNGPAFAACIGMSGWLPFRKLLEEASMEAEKGGDTTSVQQEILSVLAAKLGYMTFNITSATFQQIPLVLGHGADDNVVQPQLGREAAACMKTLGMRVTYKECQPLAHWYSPSMLSDIIDFVHAETEWV